ncbi:UvrD-helicase domain-containing protein [Sinorhizobium meliloti]|uniref:UvrD-helicase domain-containing protein n=2 Tax=Rhizobium meliloti TaxID=382 RepID=UPI0001E4B186|nr:UvrD-helicase domain-containing protein [Sinorhizobium meliloti]AEG57163.1 UvrD/REP helicase [Sinorhizobium meliloti AK83]MDE4587438.1 UvrD-helicase domain-containing protein [Sinorhizobium meliloti]SEJ80870.1 DNA helicase-2 / ATP-dependent DNA helicase PcrA [Sinorhizobium meliloti]
MIDQMPDSPALIAAREADLQMEKCLREGTNFLIEAGAGAGKTYSLIEALKFLLDHEGPRLRRGSQKIACITYTNVATAVIGRRIDNNPLVFVETVHAFCWSLVKSFQPAVRQVISESPAWQEKIAAAGGTIDGHAVEYDLGFRRIRDNVVMISHDDVLTLAGALLPKEKFQKLVAARYPYILIDEYQDTDSEMMDAFKVNLFGREGGPQFGLFGDHWQQIYDKTCGHVEHPQLTAIGKGANFRSSTAVVGVLNRMRPELPQAVADENLVGSAVAFLTNTWVGDRREGGHWKGDLPADAAHTYLQAFKGYLEAEHGWDFAPANTKVLMLTHNVLAAEQGYSQIAGLFKYTDDFIKLQDDYMAFFGESVEPACQAYAARRYGDFYRLMGTAVPVPSQRAEKLSIASAIDGLIELRTTGTIGDVIDHIQGNAYLRLPDKVAKRERDALIWEGEGDPPDRIQIARGLREIPYREIIALLQFIEGNTPFATKHSVKGDEFENVLVVLGRGWNKYDFGTYLEWVANPGAVPANKQAAFERNRNLLYVACSRPKTRLALLFTQALSDTAVRTLKTWFGADMVEEFTP